MKTVLQYIGISHKSATPEQREMYQIPEHEIPDYFDFLLNKFTSVTALMILSTCNRTEIYWESETEIANELLEYFILNQKPGCITETEMKYFEKSNSNSDTLSHLLRVANGLDSAVSGDRQILNQIKNAYNHSRNLNLQGSLLERGMQSVHKSYKRISNETVFRNGSQSTAYKALKCITKVIGKSEIRKKKLLIAGAGDISKEVLKYLPKFVFNEVYITNRTQSKAVFLAQQYNLKVFPWQQMKDNNLDNFDAVITGLSNSKDVIYTLNSDNPKVLVDLGMPGNISKDLYKTTNIEIFNVDTLEVETNKVKKEQKEAIKHANRIVQEELTTFIKWIEASETRQFLHTYKCNIETYLNEVISSQTDRLTPREVSELSSLIAGKFTKSPAKLLNNKSSNSKALTVKEIELAFSL